jgi:hypothetical protein
VPDTFGKAVKIISMDEKLLVFCEKKIGVVDGGGPTLDGLGATFSELSEVSTIGTPAYATYSFAQTDDGVWWQSSRGIRLLTRGYQIAANESGEIGKQVDEILKLPAQLPAASGVGYTVVGTSVIDRTVRWFLRDSASGTLSNTAICFKDGVFSTLTAPLTTPSAYGVAQAGQRFFVAFRNKMYVYPSTDIQVSDPPVVLDTGWLQVGGQIQDFSRVRKLVLTGQTSGIYAYTDITKKGWTFTVKVWYDMIEGTSASTTEVSAQSIVPKYEDTTSGWYNIRFEVPLSVQKCSAIRFEITATPGTYARSLRLPGMTLEVGRKRGLAKKFASSERK